jgi:hypothetical protein
MRKAFPDQFGSLAKQVHAGCIHAQSIAPMAPTRSLPARRLEIPGKALKAGGALPGSAVRMQLRSHCTQGLETLAQIHLDFGLPAVFPFKEDQVSLTDDLDPFSVEPGYRNRSGDHSIFAQRH